MKRVIIHAGPGKTGTSAIQHWMNKNREYLAEHGIFYPQHRTDCNGVSSGNLHEVLSMSDDGVRYVDKSKLNNLVDRFCNSEYDVLFLSSEFFFAHIEVLHELIPNAEFIIYFREPVSLLESNYNQSIKRHGNTSELKINKTSFYSSFLENVSRLMIDNKNISINVRLYHKDFFVGGNIISDIISFINDKIDVIVEDAVINPSYTFPALEFKRYMNNFPLHDIQADLDRLLQSYPFGHGHYTFVSDSDFTILIDKTIEQVRLLIDNGLIEFSSIPEYLLHIKNTMDRKPYYVQNIDEQQIANVVEFIKEKNGSLFYKLKDKLVENKNLILPIDYFYSCFDIDNKPPHFEFISPEFSEVLNTQFKHNADLFREIALFMEKDNKLEYAEVFMELAHLARPKGPFINQKLNEYRIARNSKADVKPRRLSWIERLRVKS